MQSFFGGYFSVVFRGRFGRIRAKILHTRKNLPALTPMPLNKPAYLWPLILRKVCKRLCICENEATIDYCHGSPKS